MSKSDKWLLGNLFLLLGAEKRYRTVSFSARGPLYIQTRNIGCGQTTIGNYVKCKVSPGGSLSSSVRVSAMCQSVHDLKRSERSVRRRCLWGRDFGGRQRVEWYKKGCFAYPSLNVCVSVSLFAVITEMLLKCGSDDLFNRIGRISNYLNRT